MTSKKVLLTLAWLRGKVALTGSFFFKAVSEEKKVFYDLNLQWLLNTEKLKVFLKSRNAVKLKMAWIDANLSKVSS